MAKRITQSWEGSRNFVILDFTPAAGRESQLTSTMDTLWTEHRLIYLPTTLYEVHLANSDEKTGKPPTPPARDLKDSQ